MVSAIRSSLLGSHFFSGELRKFNLFGQSLTMRLRVDGYCVDDTPFEIVNDDYDVVLEQSDDQNEHSGEISSALANLHASNL